MAEETPEDKIKEYKSSRSFWRMLFVCGFVVPQLLNCAGRNVNEAFTENTTFGEKTTFTGGALRKIFLATCGGDCKTVDDLMAANDAQPKEKFTGDVLRYIGKDPIGKSLVEQVAARGVVFDGNPEFFKQASVCSAAGSYGPRYGVINYSVGDMEDKDAVDDLADIFSHELFHANQKIEGKRFPANTKDEMIYTLALEAAAYAFDDVMEARRIRLSKPDAKPIPDEETLKAFKEQLKRVLTHDNFRSTRQYYIVGQNPRIGDYDKAPQGVTLQMLQDVARLPDGRSFFPDDMTVAKMDLQVRRDFYDEMKQRKPVESLPVAPAGEAGTTTVQPPAPVSKKSEIQIHRDESCKARGVSPSV